MVEISNIGQNAINCINTQHP